MQFPDVRLVINVSVQLSSEFLPIQSSFPFFLCLPFVIDREFTISALFGSLGSIEGFIRLGFLVIEKCERRLSLGMFLKITLLGSRDALPTRC